MIFPSIFKGKHIAHKKYVDELKGEKIKVQFDRPCALQIDGETILNVTEYEAQINEKTDSKLQRVQTVQNK